MDIEVIWVRWQAKFLNFRNFVARPSGRLPLRLGSDFVGACTHLGLPYESHRLQAPDRKGSTSEVQQ